MAWINRGQEHDEKGVIGLIRLQHKRWAQQIPLHRVDGLVQERRNSSVLEMELRRSCTNPSRCW